MNISVPDLSRPPTTPGERPFFIKAGYRITQNPHMYCDSLGDSQTYQVDVYRFAAEIASTPAIRSVLDIGCGLATKLVELVLPSCETITGVDSPETVARCAEIHPIGRWIGGDLEAPELSLDCLYDLIISADVIEHLRNPDRLLELIRRASHPKTVVVLSTPERDLRRGVDDMGPPGNPAHVREWNSAEFLAYLVDRGMEIRENRIVDLREGVATCQLVVGHLPPQES